MKINKILPQENNYLQILDSIAKSPKNLYYIGNLPEARVPSVAIVGTRKPSTYGREVTSRLAGDLARRGVVIISGLALGVDSVAHQSAVDAGGATLAIQANGLSKIYPASNRQLAIKILEQGGAIISEYDSDVTPRNYQFLERNRIVSGLADAIVITEAAARSGTLNTAAHALEQGKTVFVVPGNITSPLSAGCNNLLKQGATPVTCAEDVLEQIAPDLLQPQTSLALGGNEAEATILKLLQAGLRSGDELQQQSGLNVSEFSTTLTMLEINGQIRALGGNQWTIK